MMHFNKGKYKEFSQGILDLLIQQGYSHFIKKDIDFKDADRPDTAYFELAFFKTENEAQRAFELIENPNTFMSEIRNGEAIEMAAGVDLCKFYIKDLVY